MSDDFWDSDNNGIDDFVEFMMFHNAMEEANKDEGEDEYDPDVDDYDAGKSYINYTGAYDPSYYQTNKTVEELKAEYEENMRKFEETRSKDRKFVIGILIAVFILVVGFSVWVGGMSQILLLIYWLWAWRFTKKYWY